MEKDPIIIADPAQVNITNAKDATGELIGGTEVTVTVISSLESEIFNAPTSVCRTLR